jgi:hypothetical protein
MSKLFNFDGKKVEAPTKWSEVTVGHFVMPEFLSGNSIKLLAALSGIPASKLAQATEEMSPHFKKTVDFLKREPMGWRGGAVPETLEFMGVTCTVPKNIEMRAFGQKVMLGQAITESKFIYDKIPTAIAIYFGPQVLPEDWFERMDEIEAEVLKMPIAEVYPIADFFLLHSKKLKNSGMTR